MVEDWLLSQNASILNDGIATCINRGTGGWSTGAEWTLGEDLGSDHLPITTTIGCEVPAASVSQRRARWNTSNVNWTSVSSAVEETKELFPRAPRGNQKAKRSASIDHRQLDRILGGLCRDPQAVRRTTNQGKANAFMTEYAAINCLVFYKEERNRIELLKSTLKSPNAGESCCTALRKEEFGETILQMRAKGAQGQTIFPQRSLKPQGQQRDRSSDSPPGSQPRSPST